MTEDTSTLTTEDANIGLPSTEEQVTTGDIDPNLPPQDSIESDPVENTVSTKRYDDARQEGAAQKKRADALEDEIISLKEENRKLEDALADNSNVSEDDKNKLLIKQGIRQGFEEIEAKSEAEKVRELESSFFTSQGLVPGSPEHTLAVNQYNSLTKGQNKTLGFSKNIMETVYKAVTGKAATNEELAQKTMQNANVSVSGINTNPKRLTPEEEKTRQGYENETPWIRNLRKNAKQN